MSTDDHDPRRRTIAASRMADTPRHRSGDRAIAAILAALVVVPALVLAGFWRIADARAAGPDPVPLVPTAARSAPPAASLGTGLLSWRRAPSIVADDASRSALRRELTAVADGLPGDSCIEVNLQGDVVLGRDATAALIPASSLKVLVSAAALGALGAQHRFATVARGDLGADGVVAGDLVLVGGGDPLLLTDDYPRDLDPHTALHPTSLDDLADGLAAAGVTHIDGAVVGDDSRFDARRYHQTWVERDVASLGGPVGALVVNRGRAADGTAATLDTDPAANAASQLVRLLDARGIGVANGAASGAPDDVGVELARVESAPLGDLVEDVLINSDNHAAEILLKELGAADGGVGSWRSGSAALLDQLDAWDIPTDGLVIADGSGLSVDNRMSCRALATVLDRFGIGSNLGQALPVAGRDGTLADQLVGTAAEGEMAAKTGTLGNPPASEPPPATKALAGFLPASGGETLAFALVLNGPTINEAAEYGPVWERLAAALDTYPAGPGVDELGPRPALGD